MTRMRWMPSVVGFHGMAPRAAVLAMSDGPSKQKTLSTSAAVFA
jgi:hypothetical protein